MRYLPILCVLIVVAGCANKQRWQDAPTSQSQNSAALMAQGNQCYEEMKANPALNPIKGKVAFNVNEQTLQMLSNINKPTAKEKQAIALWDEKRQECSRYWDAAYPSTNTPAVFNAISSANKTATQNLIANLYAGKITYGEFAKQRKELHDRTLAAQSQALDKANKDAQDASFRNRAVAAQEAQAEAARQAQYDAAIVQGANLINSTRQAPVQSYGPRNVTCTQQGVFTNCSSY